MTERKKLKKRREETSEKILPVEYDVAKYLRKQLPQKEAMLLNHKVSYFIASKAIDCLMDSRWATKTKSQDAIFTTRDSIIEFMNTLLVHKFFHRAKKIVISSKDSKKKKKKDDSSDEKEGKKKKKTEKSKDKGEEQESKSKKDKKVEDDEKKKKKRFKLDMHLDQCFVDGTETFVWIYDPIPTKAWLIGGLLVIGAVLLCLFPLWPQSFRKGVYYLSIAAAGFLVFILALAIIRIVVFCLVWVFSFGRRHLWLLPNLTEDVGFLESFWPLFKYEYRGDEKDKNKAGEKKKNGKDTKESKDEKSEIENDDDKGSDEQEKDENGDAEDQLDNDDQGNDNEFEVLEANKDDLDESQASS